MAEATLVTVLRHGEVAGRPHVFRGASDESLTERGREQVLAVLAGLPEFNRIAASPLRRCRDVAAAAAAARGLPLEVLPGLAEMRFGAWEGYTVEEAAASHPEALAAFRGHADGAAAPGGESLGAFRQRVLAAWTAWLADGQGGHRVLISHAGVMRLLLQVVLDLPATSLYRVALPEAAHFQVSLLPGHAPILLSLKPCTDSCSPFSS
ncbi:MAG: histidine phosphatase family protein [Hydrogenophilaceae bacterium]